MVNSNLTVRYNYYLRLDISQNNRDQDLLIKIQEYLGCGTVSKTNKNCNSFLVTKLDSIINITIPFFEKHPLHGMKQLNFKDFLLAAKKIQNKEHLTEAGKIKLDNLKTGMNKGRHFKED